MCENDREDGGEFCGRGMVLGEAFPDAQDVGEQAQGHARVLGALMFEKQIEEGVALVEGDVKEQIALGTGELWVDEGAGFEREGSPVESGGDFFGEMVFKEGTGVLRDGESGLEELVVGLMNWVLRHGKERSDLRASARGYPRTRMTRRRRLCGRDVCN